MAESAGLLFKIKGENDDAIRALKETERASDSLTTATTGLGASFGSVEAIAAIATTSIIAVGVAAIAATRSVYEMSKAASEFGSQIFDASQKTGLSAERLSAMKFAADQSGTSLDQVTSAAARFSKTIGDAGNGSAEAQKKLDRLGVTSKDLDTGLKQALETIVKTDSGTKQMALAMDAFGKSGADLLPFIKSFDGDLDALTAKAKALGVTLTDEDAKAADEFGDQLDTLNAQFAGLGRTIGFAFMPVFNNMAKSMSDFLVRNQEEIRRWAQGSSDMVRGFILTMEQMSRVSQQATGSSATAWIAWGMKIHGTIDPLIGLFQRLLVYMKQVGQESRVAEEKASRQLGWSSFKSTTGGSVPVPTSGGGGGGGGSRGGGRSSSSNNEAERQAREAEQLAARDLTAQTRLESINLKTVQDQMVIAYKEMRDALGGDDSIAAFTEETNKATQKWASNLLDALRVVEALETAALKSDATEHERALLLQQQEERRHKLKLDQEAEIKKNADAAWDLRMKRAEIARTQEEEDYQTRKEHQEQFERDAGFGNIPTLGALVNGPVPKEGEDYEAAGPFDAWTRSWDEFFTRVSEDGPTLSAVFEDLGGIMQGAFEGLAQSIGSVVQQWVIYGNTGPAVMRKMLAAVLASVAAEAAVKAIMATAEGFYFLATHQYDSAANAFIAAGFYGAVAGVAALAGRAVAGDSFKQQSNRATGTSSSSGQGSSGNQGQAYSPYGTEATVYEQSRNQPAGATVQIGLKDGASRILADLLTVEMKNNGPFRDMIRGAAEG